MSEIPVSERIGITLGLVLDLDTATYGQLREEFLAMTARAAQDSGVSRAVLARKVKAAGVAKSTVYNYAGDPNYKSFPQPKQLTAYLQACGFTPEQVVFAVARCELIRILYPEGETFRPPPTSWPVPMLGLLGIKFREYEQQMQETSEQVRSLLSDVVPARVALKVIGAGELPFTGGPDQFVRELFARTDIPMASEVDFTAPPKMSPLEQTPVRAWDIIRTEHGYLGILTETRRLIYLGQRGWPSSMLLGDQVRVAAWRLTPVQRDYGLITTASRVAARRGRQRKDKSTAASAPRLTAVVALVCEKLQIAHRHGVVLPVSARDMFDAAVTRGVEFDYTVSAWAPTPRSRTQTPTPTKRRTASPPPIRRTAIPTEPASPPPPSPPPPPTQSIPGRYPIMPPAALGEQGMVGEVRWYTAVGEQVHLGQLLAQIENPLAGLEIEVHSPATGTLTDITAPTGDIVGSDQQLGVVTAPPSQE